MFYVLVGLWIVACVGSCALKNVRRGYLITSCPCVGVSGFVFAATLYLAGQFTAAAIALVVAVFLLGTLIWSLKRQTDHTPGVFEHLFS